MGGPKPTGGKLGRGSKPAARSHGSVQPGSHGGVDRFGGPSSATIMLSLSPATRVFPALPPIDGRYQCLAGTREQGKPVCQSFAAFRVDQAVEAEVLKACERFEVEASTQAITRKQSEAGASAHGFGAPLLDTGVRLDGCGGVPGLGALSLWASYPCP